MDLESIFIPVSLPIQMGLLDPNVLSVAVQEQMMRMAGLS